MRLQNDMEIEIHTTWYNKTTVQPDGVTHIVDTSKRYIAYQFGMAKNYFGLDTKDEVLDEIIADLQSTIEELTKMKENSKMKDMEKERE